MCECEKRHVWIHFDAECHHMALNVNVRNTVGLMFIISVSYWIAILWGV